MLNIKKEIEINNWKYATFFAYTESY